MITTDLNLLKVKCEDVLPEEIGTLRETLENELKRSAEFGAPGIGLAAPQIGIAKKMAIIRIQTNYGSIFHVDLVNCKFQKGFDPNFFLDEGCLSFPGKTVKTWRFQEVYFTNNLVEPYNFIATGLPAVCIQHEFDHLCGILLPDLENKVQSEELNRIRGLYE